MQPQDSRSYYFNYKGFHSIVLMAVANHDYEFIFCDVGTNGRISDGGVLQRTEFFHQLVNDDLDIPECRKINDSMSLNYVFVGDDAFSLRPDFMKPYSHRSLNYEERIFNYRLSRARRIIENVFGILVKRFHIFRGAIDLDLHNIRAVVLACCALHNFLRRRSTNYITQEEINIEDHSNNYFIRRQALEEGQLNGLQLGRDRNPTKDAKAIRDDFKKYFNGDGKVDF